ncbi:hypothetical protein R3W88_014519 [Solanum pinnatisectum]|uniref:Uncharacterized protein n=1 Tax=Solanum pinnatisectum TaxID=50273 RepID=A0AAV9KS95_9SOLN|nr:hypothetical protein R3W88_014519 [Solanum pinnatisectum]
MTGKGYFGLLEMLIRESEKNLQKKLALLCKKAYKLSILCHVKASIVPFTTGKTNIFAWLSLTKANDIVNYYLDFPEKQRQHKLVEHEAYLQSIVNDREKDIRELEKMVVEKEMENIFNQLVGGRKRFDEFDVSDIKGL